MPSIVSCATPAPPPPVSVSTATTALPPVTRDTMKSVPLYPTYRPDEALPTPASCFTPSRGSSKIAVKRADEPCPAR